MPFERIAKCFRDVLDAISLIETWVEDSGGADQAISQDVRTRSAIERQLLVISEAAIRLDKLDPTVAPRLAPTVDWAGIRGIGNFIRHKYDDFDTSILVDVVRNRLTELRDACVPSKLWTQRDRFRRRFSAASTHRPKTIGAMVASLILTRSCSGNSNSNAQVVQPAKDWPGEQVSFGADLTRNWCVPFSHGCANPNRT